MPQSTFFTLFELQSIASSPQDIDDLIAQAIAAEENGFDALYLRESTDAQNKAFEALSLAAIIAAHTRSIGLISELLPSLTQPYNIARRVLSLDHLSQGRSGWSLVPRLDASLIARRGGEAQNDQAQNERSAEFAKVLRALWQSWQADARVIDKASGVHVALDRVHPINHKGKYFQVAGAIDSPRSVQGTPIQLQHSDDLAAFAAGGVPDLVLLNPAKDLAAQLAQIERFGNPRLIWPAHDLSDARLVRLRQEGVICGALLRANQPLGHKAASSAPLRNRLPVQPISGRILQAEGAAQ